MLSEEELAEAVNNFQIYSRDSEIYDGPILMGVLTFKSILEILSSPQSPRLGAERYFQIYSRDSSSRFPLSQLELKDFQIYSRDSRLVFWALTFTGWWVVFQIYSRDSYL